MRPEIDESRPCWRRIHQSTPYASRPEVVAQRTSSRSRRYRAPRQTTRIPFERCGKGSRPSSEMFSSASALRRTASTPQTIFGLARPLHRNGPCRGESGCWGCCQCVGRKVRNTRGDERIHRLFFESSRPIRGELQSSCRNGAIAFCDFISFADGQKVTSNLHKEGVETPGTQGTCASATQRTRQCSWYLAMGRRQPTDADTDGASRPSCSWPARRSDW